MEEAQGAFEEKENETAETVGVEKSAVKGGKRLKKGGGKGLLIAGIAVGVLAAAYLGLCAWARFDTKIAPNTIFAGVNYGRLTRAQAETQLQERIDRAREAAVSFVLPDGTEIADVALGSISVDVDVQDIVGSISAKGYHGFLAGGAYYVKALVGGGMTVSDHSCDEAFAVPAREVCAALESEPVEFSIGLTPESEVSVTKPMDGRKLAEGAEEAVTALLRDAYFGGGETTEYILEPVSEDNADGAYEVVPAQAVDLAAEREKLVGGKVNASYDIENGTIVPSRVGVSFTLAELQSAYDAAKPGETFTVAAAVEQPEVTTGALEAGLFRDELSSYTTRVGGAPGRHKNVQLTAERINGYILNAGDTMKYGPLVTPFTAENGYYAAPGYLNGKTVDMIGGGACQASSTLYAAVLYANLEIVQRVNHGYASDYIGLGLDATVASGGPEFEFRNNTLYPVKVQAEFFTKGGKDYIKVTLLGTKTDDHYVKMVTEVLSTTPYEEEIVETDTLAPGERRVEQTAYTGYVVKTYRNVYAGDGTLLSSTYEATSRYKSRNRIVLVGKAAEPAGETSAEVTEPTEQTAETATPTTDVTGQVTEPATETPAVDTAQTPVEAETPQTAETAPAA